MNNFYRKGDGTALSGQIILKTEVFDRQNSKPCLRKQSLNLTGDCE